MRDVTLRGAPTIREELRDGVVKRRRYADIHAATERERLSTALMPKILMMLMLPRELSDTR